MYYYIGKRGDTLISQGFQDELECEREAMFYEDIDYKIIATFTKEIEIEI